MNETTLALQVFALRDIEVGEEITYSCKWFYMTMILHTHTIRGLVCRTRQTNNG
jgi:hypothetical protein